MQNLTWHICEVLIQKPLTMKHVIIIAAMLISGLNIAQSSLKESHKAVEMKNLGISITVDSLEELNESLRPETITDFTDMVKGNEKISFELVCNKNVGKNNLKTFVIYKVEGYTENLENFMELVQKTKQSATNFYKNTK